jgi:hypothetical protein
MKLNSAQFFGGHPVVTVLCLVLEISILLSFLHSKLSNKVIFPQLGLLYSLVVFENDILHVFRKSDLPS